jgi:hypothetical protein
MKAAAATTSTFHKDKTGNRPSVIHGVDTAGFESVNTAIEKDLGLLLTPETSLGTNFVYSVHYSDINGLSNLESNILAHEISIYFCKYKDKSGCLTEILRTSSPEEPTFLHHPVDDSQQPVSSPGMGYLSLRSTRNLPNCSATTVKLAFKSYYSCTINQTKSWRIQYPSSRCSSTEGHHSRMREANQR